MIVHTLVMQGQPLADQWMGTCSCGWRTTVSLYEIADRDAVIAEIRHRHTAHLTNINPNNHASVDIPPAP